METDDTAEVEDDSLDFHDRPALKQTETADPSGASLLRMTQRVVGVMHALAR